MAQSTQDATESSLEYSRRDGPNTYNSSQEDHEWGDDNPEQDIVERSAILTARPYPY